MQKMPFVCLIFLITCMAFSGCGRKEEIKTLRVAIPYSDYIQDPETNYYIKWLENKTGLQLEIIDIYSNRVSEYLDTLF